MKAKRIQEIINECQELIDDTDWPATLSETGIQVKEVLELAKIARKRKSMVKEEQKGKRRGFKHG